MSARMYVVGALLALLVPALAHAWPVDLVVPLEPGKERFHKLDTVDWVQVADASVADAELLPGSNELLLTGQKAGRTLLLLYAGGRFAVWRLTVGSPPPEDPAPRRPRPARPVRT
ncbi:pilus assembly protein N-terminal domain-containing protein [Myxococcus sp. MxC21-1]|nr:pilus assembly protein N-terminal domain-containing protein [Myxococcus sp. MxC21-1]WNZ63504.1 pilus assembly protein N-terminal domain-containing protein [Myxococcus sp. MxC21-1]